MNLSTPERTETPEDRLRRHGLVLPPPASPIGRFLNFVQEGNLIYLSGQGPRENDGFLHKGKVGRDISVEEAYGHARLTALNLVSVMQEAVGELTRIRRIVKIFGMVNAIPEFEDHPEVINGCSDLLVEIFGAGGHHSRSAVGVASLPNNITVEIEAVVALK